MSTGRGKREQKKQRATGVLVTVLSVAVVLALVGVGLKAMLVKAPDVSDKEPFTPVEDGTEETEEPEDTDREEETPEIVNERRDQVYTFLLLGKDTGGGGNTDTMLLVTYDVPAGTIDVLTIPRDTMINVPWNIKKINAVYASSRGLEGLKTEVGHLTGIVPDFTVIVEWEAIGKIVDALDGVYFNVPYDMDYDDPYQDLYIHQEKGYRLLSGDDAMQVIRWRANNDGSPYGYCMSDGGVGDTGRQKIQRDFLKAVAEQCLQLKNWTKVSAFAEIFFESVKTDIPWNNLIWFAEQAMELDPENITFHSMPGNPEGWYYTPSLGVNLNYFFADPEGIAELINEHFNPWTLPISVEDLQIVYKNEDASLGITSGELADPKMAVPSVKPPSAPKQEETEEESVPSEEGEEPTIPADTETGDTEDTNT